MSEQPQDLPARLRVIAGRTFGDISRDLVRAADRLEALERAAAAAARAVDLGYDEAVKQRDRILKLMAEAPASQEPRR